ncbi:hypothetical protein BOTCAL_0062g00340 [Botryotinia calthae]|uniref:Uncharacterized protein n=1 Tax=Botryotinia calthae TaxID=38488 RepID=A0A4Y8DC65_9HELO|nr:hypothetical protein BOTCAL_0062g00340 [Botryotinia calthae]
MKERRRELYFSDSIGPMFKRSKHSHDPRETDCALHSERTLDSILISVDPAISGVVNSQFSEARGFSEVGASISKAGVGEESQSGLILSEMINIELQWANLFDLISPYRHCYWDTAKLDWEDGKSLSVATLSNDITNATFVGTYFEDALYSDSKNIVRLNWLGSINGLSYYPSFTEGQYFISVYYRIVVTDGLARYRAKDVFFNSTMFGNNEPLAKFVSSSKASKPLNGFLQWDSQVWRWVYSYGVRSIMTKPSPALLLAHVMAFGFIIYLFFNGSKTSAWSSFGE